MEKDTEQLMNQIKKADDFQQLFEEHESYLIKEDIKEYLHKLLEEKKIKKIAVIRAAQISEVTGYQYFDGKRKPAREKVVALAIGFKLNIEETNELLKKTGYARLYPKHHWDTIIIYGLTHNHSLMEINDLLFEAGLPTLSES